MVRHCIAYITHLRANKLDLPSFVKLKIKLVSLFLPPHKRQNKSKKNKLNKPSLEKIICMTLYIV